MARISQPRKSSLALLLVLACGGAHAESTDCTGAESCRPVELALSYSGDWRRNTSGGVEVGSAYSSLIEAGLSVSPITLPGGLRFSANASLMYSSGKGISEAFIGDLHGVNNIEAPSGWRAYEVWAEFQFANRDTSVRAGLLDLNSEFDAPVTSAHFVGPAHGIGTEFAQTGLNGPSIWPVTGFGVRVAQTHDRWTFRFGAFDAVPGSIDEDRFAYVDLSADEGALLAAEIEWSAPHFNKLAIGAWSYTAAFESIDSIVAGTPETERGNRGVYALLDAQLGTVGNASLNGFLRVGYASPRFNAVRTYVGAGLVANNFISGRPEDALGLAIAYGGIGDAYRSLLESTDGSSRAGETAAELTYRWVYDERLAVLPSVQWIHAPGATGTLANAWAVGIRLEWSAAKSLPWLARNGAPGSETLMGSRE